MDGGGASTRVRLRVYKKKRARASHSPHPKATCPHPTRPLRPTGSRARDDYAQVGMKFQPGFDVKKWRKQLLTLTLPKDKAEPASKCIRETKGSRDLAMGQRSCENIIRLSSSRR